MPRNIRGMTTNFAAEIRAIIESYQNHGMGIPHGLQKDNIQNSWGARKTKRGADFSVHIDLIEKEEFSAVTFTDSGTVGLTGTEYSDLREIESELDFGDERERLANFEKHKNVGRDREEQRTGGFVGQGKLMSNIHSSKRKIYYDSFRLDDDKYLINTRYFTPPELDASNMDIKMEDVLWGEDAIKHLEAISKDHLKPLEKSGTRIIIMDPTQELKDYIKTGQMLEDIEYTWWEILLKYPINGIFVKHSGVEKKAEVPAFFKENYVFNENDENRYFAENVTVAGFGKIKKMVFGFTDEKLPNHLNGLTIQRAQMPINQASELYGTPFSGIDIPDSHKDRFYGIIILNDELEGNIRPIELETHYSLKPRPRTGFQFYDRFKNTIIDNGVEPLKEKCGLTSTGSDTNERARRIGNQARKDINALFSEKGVSGGNTGREKTPFIVSVKSTSGLKEPNFLEDIVKIRFQIKNKKNHDVSSKIDINVLDEQNNFVESLFSDNDIELASRANKILNEVEVTLNREIYNDGDIYKVQCIADVAGMKYKDVQRILINRIVPTNEKEFIVTPNIENWPQENNRVDTNEELQNISCMVSSNILDTVKVFLDIQLYNKDNNRKLNGRIFNSDDFTLEPNGKEEIDNIQDITLDDELTEGIGSGRILLRFSLRAAENYANNKKGDRLAYGQVLIYFNIDPPGSGIFEEIRYEQMGSDSAQGDFGRNYETGGFRCFINTDHLSYKIYYELRTDKPFDTYTRDIIIRQGLLTCVRENLPKIFDDLESFDGLSPEEINKMVNSRHGALLDEVIRNN